MKYTRLIAALIVIAVIVLVAPGAVGAWNTRVQQEPVAVNSQGDLQENARPQGTVQGSSQIVINKDACVDLSTYCLTADEAGLVAEAVTELPEGVTLPEDENIELTRLVQITSTQDGKEALEADVDFTLDPPLAEGESVAFWDGEEWVEPEVTDGKFVVPAGTKLPVVIAVFTK
jgi:hypothetical protein